MRIILAIMTRITTVCHEREEDAGVPPSRRIFKLNNSTGNILLKNKKNGAGGSNSNSSGGVPSRLETTVGVGVGVAADRKN